MGPRRARLLIAAIAATALVVVAGCDLQPDASDEENGRQLFVEKCGTCHTLSEAATTATIGPDLDASFANARSVGMTDNTIEGVVKAQIANPRATDPDSPTYMPPELVSGRDADDVAAYVGQVAGVPGIEPPTAPGGPGGQVFASNGCGSCHTFEAAGSSGTVGPNLDDVLAGQSPGQVEQSIVDPEADISQGFDAGAMPADYGQTIDPKDLQLLVDFLLGSAGNGGGN